LPRIAIVTDSTADLDREALSLHHIETVPLGLRIGQDVFLDQLDIDAKEFIARLSMSAPHPTTFSPTASAFEAVFRRLAADHDAIVAVLLSSKLGGSVRAANTAAKAVASIIRVDVIDSMNVSLGLGFQVLRAVELVERGLSVDDLVTRLNAERTLYQLAFFCDSLDYLQHGGRIGLAASLVGGLLQLKPILQIEEGQVVPLDRTRTRAKAAAGLIDFAAGFARIDRLGLLYSTELADAESLRAELANRCQPERTVVAQFSPVLTAHVGPGALGVCVFEGPEPI
jgi:DegV family protein with EDD domain